MIINNEEDEQLPKPSGGKGRKGDWLPPASKDKLISSGSRFSRKKREKELEELEKKKEEQIYNKNREEEEEKLQEEKKVQVVFMKPNGSFVFQTLMEFHQVYSVLYFIIEELLFVYKCYYFHYEPYAAVFEILCLIFYLFIQFGRFFFGSLGNRAEASLFVIFCIIFSIGALYSYAHYMLLQTYVLQIEIITNSVGMVLWFLEVVFAVIAFLRISGKESGI